MASAVFARNLDPLHAPTDVRVSIDRAGDSIEKGRPTTARVELGRCLVEWRIAAGTCVDTFFGVVLVVLACACHFGPLFTQDTELFRVELGAPFRVGHALRKRLGGRLG